MFSVCAELLDFLAGAVHVFAHLLFTLYKVVGVLVDRERKLRQILLLRFKSLQSQLLLHPSPLPLPLQVILHFRLYLRSASLISQLLLRLNAASFLSCFPPPLLVQPAIVHHGGLHLRPSVFHPAELLLARHLDHVLRLFQLVGLVLAEALFRFPLHRFLTLVFLEHQSVALFLLQLFKQMLFLTFNTAKPIFLSSEFIAQLLLRGQAAVEV